MAQEATAAVVLIHTPVASAPVERIDAVPASTLQVIGTLHLCTLFGLQLSFLLRVEIKVIILGHRSQWYDCSHKDCQKTNLSHIFILLCYLVAEDNFAPASIL